MGNWDVMENVLDQVFVSLGVENGERGGIGRSILMTEPVAALGYTRKSEDIVALDLRRADRSNSDERDFVRVLRRS